MTDLLENLNEEQLRAVTHPKGPLLIVAGAGTGKTTVITRRIGWLLQQKLCRADEILALTFTDKAAGEMEERLDQMLPLGQFDMWISTFHSFAQRLLEERGLEIGLPNNFRVVSDAKQWMLVYKNFERFKLKYYKPIATPHKFIDALLKHFSRCKDELVTPEDYLQYAQNLKLSLDNPDFVSASKKTVEAEEEEEMESLDIERIEELASAYHTYQQILLEEDSLDFGDLINYAVKLLQSRPNVLRYYQRKFKYILVDEFQDTNIAQYELVKLLAGGGQSEIKSEEGKVKSEKGKDLTDSGAKSSASYVYMSNITVVGDDDQAIYKFRGASVSNILKFKEDFPHIKEVTLTQNYRSTQEILDFAYNFIKHNDPNRLEVKLGIVKRLVNPNSNKGKGKKEKGKGEIVVLEGKDLSEEVDLVVKKILEIKTENPASSWNDFAILVRSKVSCDEILPKLEAVGIPFVYMANKGLYRKSLIANLISYFKLLDNYHESGSLYRVLNFSKFRMSAEDIAHLTQFTMRKTLSLFEALKNEESLEKLSPEGKACAGELLATIAKHGEMVKERTAVELFVQIILDLGVAENLTEETLETAQSREFLDQFFKMIESYEKEADDKSLRGFLEYLELEQRAGEEGKINFDAEIGPEALKVLTIHSAKGLEFENVFVVNMVDQRFPSRAKSETIELPTELVKDILPEGDFHMQEERRLFYVASTRAKKRLFFSWAKDYGGARNKKPSIFLVESGLLPSEAIVKSTGKVILTRPTLSPKKQVYKVLPTSFSFSSLNSFLQCPLEYKYAHYLKLPLPGSPFLSFGSTMHSVFEEYLKMYQREVFVVGQDLFGKSEQSPSLPSFSLLEELYGKYWLDEWYINKQQKQEYRVKGKVLLNVFFEHCQKHTPKVAFLEKPFKLQFGENVFTGKIDRADFGERGLVIIDYKTGKQPKSKSAGDVDQLRIYQLAVRDFLKEKTESLNYWYIEENIFKEVKLANEQELEDLQNHIQTTINDIQTAVKFDLFAELHAKSKQHNCKFEGW